MDRRKNLSDSSRHSHGQHTAFAHQNCLPAWKVIEILAAARASSGQEIEAPEQRKGGWGWERGLRGASRRSCNLLVYMIFKKKSV